MENDAAKIAHESFGRLCAVDARQCRLVSDFRREVLSKDQPGNNHSETFQHERGLVALANLRCVIAVSPPASLPSGIKPISRRHDTGVSLRTWLLKKSVRQSINDCWRPFGNYAKEYVEQEVQIARLEIKALKTQKKNGSLQKDDRRRLKYLRTHLDNVTYTSTNLKEIDNPKEALSDLERDQQERVETLNNILAEKAKAAAVVAQL